jgi:hypothetical protein
MAEVWAKLGQAVLKSYMDWDNVCDGKEHDNKMIRFTTIRVADMQIMLYILAIEHHFIN